MDCAVKLNILIINMQHAYFSFPLLNLKSVHTFTTKPTTPRLNES